MLRCRSVEITNLFIEIPKEDVTLDYRCAYLAAIDEFNSFGANSSEGTGQYRIEKTLANLMYGFKARQTRCLCSE